MKKNWIILTTLWLALAACSTQKEVPSPTPKPAAIDEYPLPTERGDYFAASGVCTTCHKDMVDKNGQDVSIDAFWRGTMMANAARDPYWQASVRGEVLHHPDYNEVIQDKCTTCHTPMARTTRVFTGGAGELLDEGFLDSENDLHVLAIDGISCTLCHQIDDEGLGEETSFGGGFIIDSTLPVGERIGIGPYDVTDENAILMKSASGYVPVTGQHIQTSEFCGSCHTLFTPTIDNQGEIAGLFPEQTTYIEWLASDYSAEQSCQDCHMPETHGEVVLSTTGTPGREQFSRHSFAGGNTYALNLLKTYGDEIGTTASADQIAAALNRAEDQLQEQTAQLTIDNWTVVDSSLMIDLRIESHVGHKFPSGFPSRRVWVHLVVEDANDVIIFESGKWSEDGGIFGNDNDLDPAAFEPHYQVIDNPDQVQIYEAIMGDVDGAVTTTLLRGSVYLKDNRMLPMGFLKESVVDEIAVYGNADSDPDFQGGEDMVQFQVGLDDAQGPFTISTQLLYQSVGYRWAQNLRGLDAPEPQTFIKYYEALPNLPTVVSSDSVEANR